MAPGALALGGMLGFFLRADGAFSPPAFDRRVPPRFAGWVGSLEWDYLRLNPLENPWCITQSRFKAVSTAGVSLWGAADVMRASMGGPGGFLRHCSGGVGVCSSPAVLGGGVGCGRREHSLVWNQETGGGGGPTGGVVARSPVQNPGSESRRSLGQRLGGEILRVPWPSGWSTVYLGPGPWDFSPGTAGALRKSALSTRGGIIEKKFLFFPKRLL